MRQSVALMGAHVAFSAVIGAGFGIARQLGERRRRRLVITIGFLIAISGHFLSNAALPYVADLEQKWFTPSPVMYVVVWQPLAMVLLQGPFVVIYVLLLRRGLRDQASALAHELGREAHTRSGAVTAAAVPILLNPIRRFKLKILAARRYGGLTSYRYITRLHAAQLELGMHLWHRSRQEVDRWAPDEHILRSRVIHLRRNPPPGWHHANQEALS